MRTHFLQNLVLIRSLKIEIWPYISPYFIISFSPFILLLTPIFESKITRIICKIAFISAAKNWILTPYFSLFYTLFLAIFYQDQPYLWLLDHTIYMQKSIYFSH